MYNNRIDNEGEDRKLELRSLREGKWFFDFIRAEEMLYIHVFEINMVIKIFKQREEQKCK